MTTELDYTAAQLLGTLYMRHELIPVAASILRIDGLLEGPAAAAWRILKEHSANGKLNVPAAQAAFDRNPQASAVIGEAQRLILNPYSYDADDVAAWASDLAEAGYRRVLQGDLQLLERKVNDLAIPLDDVIAEAMQKFSGVRQGGASTWQSLADAAAEAEDLLAQWEAGQDTSGVATGFYSLDEVIHVMPNGELILLAARPSQGKTQLAVQIMFNVARRYKQARERGAADGDKCVAIFSAETSGKRLALRIACASVGVNQMDLKRGRASAEEREAVLLALDEMRDLPFYIDSSPNPTTENMLVRSLALHNVVLDGRKMRVGLLAFDFIELAGDTADNEEQRISRIARGLKVIGKTLDVPVLALSQLNRRVEERNPPMPQVSDLRWSGMLEQIAYQILFIYRPAYYVKRGRMLDGYKLDGGGNIAWPPSDPGGRLANVIVAKNKDGEVGIVQMQFIEEHAEFRDTFDPHAGSEPPTRRAGNGRGWAEGVEF